MYWSVMFELLGEEWKKNLFLKAAFVMVMKTYVTMRGDLQQAPMSDW